MKTEQDITTSMRYAGEDILSISKTMQGQLNHFLTMNSQTGVNHLNLMNMLDIVIVQAEELKGQLIVYRELGEVLELRK